MTKKCSKVHKKCQKITRFLAIFYGSTISRMRFCPHKPRFCPKSPSKKNIFLISLLSSKEFAKWNLLFSPTFHVGSSSADLVNTFHLTVNLLSPSSQWSQNIFKSFQSTAPEKSRSVLLQSFESVQLVFCQWFARSE